jgi:nicotinate-nucleotide pyrophosphorylase (carboxylating)
MSVVPTSMKSTTNIIDFSTLLPQHLDRAIQQWLEDDLPSFDVGGMVVGSDVQSAQLFMKTTSGCVFAGKPFFERVFSLSGCTVKWETFDSVEGAHISLDSSIDGCKVLLATVTGPVNSILRGERTALNILSRCSGVATAAAKAVQIARDLGWKGFIAGTRKTTPGFRMVEKYGLLVGGAATHRLDLSQMVMLKDNHIWSTGSISSAVGLARAAAGFSQKIEVECQSKEEAIEAATAGADVSHSLSSPIGNLTTRGFISSHTSFVHTDCYA